MWVGALRCAGSCCAACRPAGQASALTPRCAPADQTPIWVKWVSRPACPRLGACAAAPAASAAPQRSRAAACANSCTRHDQPSMCLPWLALLHRMMDGRTRTLSMLGGSTQVIYADPVWYVQSALAINEFKSPRWQSELVTEGTYAGHTVRPGGCAALNALLQRSPAGPARPRAAAWAPITAGSTRNARVPCVCPVHVGSCRPPARLCMF